MSKQLSKSQLITIINKQFEMNGISATYNDIKGEILAEGNEPWYSRYTTTNAIENEFTLWLSDFLKKELKITKKEVERAIPWFLLSYGLKNPELSLSSETK